MNTLPLLLSPGTETPYYIDPLFLFRVRDTEVEELIGTYSTSIPTYTTIADGPWEGSYFAKKSYSTGLINIASFAVPAGAFTFDFWCRFAVDTIAGSFLYHEYFNSLQELHSGMTTTNSTLTVGGSTGRVSATNSANLTTYQGNAKYHVALIASGGPGSSVRFYLNGVPGTVGTRGNALNNTGYLRILQTTKCEFAEVTLRLGDATATEGDPLYIASGTTFTPPTGPYLLAED